MKRISKIGGETVVAMLTAAFVIACGASEHSRDKGGTVLEKVGEDDAAIMMSVAPEAFEKAAQCAALANEMAERGDAVAEERFSLLSKYQLRLARMMVEKRRLEARIRKTAAERERVSLEIENANTTLDDMAREAERRDLRAHLVSVVDETRRRAAAEEELRERRYSGKDKKALGQARERVASEMISRTKLWLDTLPFLVDGGAESGQETLRRVREAIAAAEADLEERDVALIQENLERAGAKARALLTSAWEGATTDREVLMQQATRALTEAGFSISDSDFGIVLPVSNKTPETSEILEKLSGMSGKLDGFGIVVLASAGQEKGAGEKSAALAERVAGVLSSTGVSKTAVRHRGAGSASPLKVLRDKETSVALLLVPLLPEQ